MHKPTMVYELVGDVIVLFHGPEKPDNTDWKIYIDFCRRHAAAVRGIFVAGHPECPGPDATQRKIGTSMWQEVGKNPPIVALTESTMILGMVTAFAWFIPGNMKAFRHKHWREALAVIGVAGAEAEKIYEVAKRLASSHYGLTLAWE